MLKINARPDQRASIEQQFSTPITKGKLVQDISVFIPKLTTNSPYRQTLHISRLWSAKNRTTGGRAVQLIWTNPETRLCINANGKNCGFSKTFPPLESGKWQHYIAILEKQPTPYTWKLTLSLAGKILFESGVGGDPFINFAAQNANNTADQLGAIFIGDGSCDEEESNCSGSGTFFFDDLSSANVIDSDTAPKYNVVVFLSDDQRFDTLWAMPLLNDALTNRGVEFTSTYVSDPLCCPDRASLLSGGFLQKNTGVLTNEKPNGGVWAFSDSNSLAVKLQQSGYTTGHFGKYLNGYSAIAPYIPPGWTKFISAPEKVIAGRPDWFNYGVVTGSSTNTSTQGILTKEQNSYITSYLKNQTLAFLDTVGDKPFFIYFTAPAPHSPATPDTQDANLFSDFTYNGRAFGEEDLSDKPQWVKDNAARWPTVVSHLDNYPKKQLRTLQSLDRAIDAVVDKIKNQGKLNNTVFIFASDNGNMWGEHKFNSKGLAYEESLRVPMVVVYPGVAPRKDNHLIVSNLDIGATIFNVAGVSSPTDGSSLVPLLKNPSSPWRTEFFFNSFGQTIGQIGTWAGLRIQNSQGNWKFVEHPTGEKELYNLTTDPFEETNLANQPAYQATVSDLTAKVNPQKGLAIISYLLPGGTVSKNYQAKINTWGGKAPLSWQIVSGSLPTGLQLNSTTGIISGTPQSQGSKTFVVKVTDSSKSPYDNRPQTFSMEYKLTITSEGQQTITNRTAKPQVTDENGEVE